MEKKDPNLPKRPANPFFRFCQEQRPIVLDQIITSGKGVPTKQDLTKRLAITWNTMGHNDKKVCIKKYYIDKFYKTIISIVYFRCYFILIKFKLFNFK